MSTTVPSPRLSPMAGLVNALLRLHNRIATAYIRELETLLADALNLNHQLRDARDYADSERAGYIDRTGLEG